MINARASPHHDDFSACHGGENRFSVLNASKTRPFAVAAKLTQRKGGTFARLYYENLMSCDNKADSGEENAHDPS
jgi:hypothetical protein